MTETIKLSLKLYSQTCLLAISSVVSVFYIAFFLFWFFCFCFIYVALWVEASLPGEGGGGGTQGQKKNRQSKRTIPTQYFPV